MNLGLLKTADRRQIITLLTVLAMGFPGLTAFAENCTPEQMTFHPGTVVDNSLPVECRLAQSHTLAFRQAFQRVVDAATVYLLGQAHTPQDAVVLDLDETLMDNRAYYLVYENYSDRDWADWVHMGQAPAIPETLTFVQWLRGNGYKIYFISGRKESWRVDTEKNLRDMGVPAWDGLFMKPDDYNRDSAADFKTAARQAIQAKGETVVLSIGDQQSDLKGGYGQGFLLPNPIYFIP